MDENNGLEQTFYLPRQRISALEQAGGLLLVLGLGWIIGAVRFLHSRRGLWLILPAVSQTLMGLLFWVFRDPKRNPPEGEHLILAPADGTVAGIAQQDETRFLRGPASRIEIRTTLREPQVNRAPQHGFIGYRRYELGGLSPTDPDDSNWLGILGPDDFRLLLRQVASPAWRRLPIFLARRINCWPDLGDGVMAGQRIGHLPLGGRVEIYLPASASIVVKSGQRVIAGQTVLAVLPPLAG